MSGVISLGGRRWTLAPLPWRAVRAIQPALGAVWSALGESGGFGTVRLAEADLDRFAMAVWIATQSAEDGPKMNFDEFSDLRFAVIDLVRALPTVAAACGMTRAAVGAGEAAPEAGKSIGTD
jgi:hypothetical protein